MHFFTLIFTMAFSITAYCQPVLNMNFNSTPLDSIWVGDLNDFKVVNTELNSAGPTDKKAISLATSLSANHNNMEWEFYCRLDFNPTTSNYSKIYLKSDQSDLNMPLNGYYIRTGGVSGNLDAIDLYKQIGNIHTKILSGKAGSCGKSINKLRIKVQNYENGLWVMYLDSLGNHDFFEQGKCIDRDEIKGNWFGISCIYTATRFNKFFFDDLRISKAPAILLNTQTTSDTTIIIKYSEAIKNPIPADCFTINLNSVSTKSENANEIILTSKTRFKKINKLDVCTLEDINGSFIYPANITYRYTQPIHKNSILINEVFADPAPSISLPEYEFVELFNRSSDTIFANHLRFKDNSTIGYLHDTIILPLEYVILCSSQAAPEFSKFGKVISVIPWPSINNDYDQIYITDTTGTILDSLQYTFTLFESSEKKTGGYSVELVNPSEICKGLSNWKESKSEFGGTPGRINSSNSNLSDTTYPSLMEIIESEPHSIKLKFDKEIFTANAKIELNGTLLSDFSKVNSTEIILNSIILKKREFNLLSLSGIEDCLGNKLNNFERRFFYGNEIGPSDILINEILFNPHPYGVDFIEVYNNSNTMINLKNLEIESYDVNEQKESCTVNHDILLHPSHYYVFTPDSEKLLSHHPNAYAQNIYTLEKLPSFRDDKGKIRLSFNQVVIDSMSYNQNYHSQLLHTMEGVSLERVNPQFPSDHFLTWHSSAQPNGFATPGYENSQKTKVPNSSETLIIEPPIFSPDFDGYNDFTIIRLKNIGTGFKGSIKIFDLNGRLIKLLQNNILLPEGYAFEWDGTTEEGLKAKTGHYIVLINIFDSKGNIQEFKEIVAVTGKF